MFFSVREKFFMELGHLARVEQLMAEGKIKLLKQYWWVKFEGVDESKTEGSDLFFPADASCNVFMRLK